MTQVINDPIVGKLENNNGSWEGKWNMSGNHTVRILAELENNREQLPEKFYEFLKLTKEKDADFRRASAKSLIKLYNEDWTEGEQITEEEFARRIRLDSISFDEEDDKISVYYDDADLFAGHAIKVDVSFDGTVLKAGLP